MSWVKEYLIDSKNSKDKFLVDGSSSWTYKELFLEIQNICKYFKSQNISPKGNLVLSGYPNCEFCQFILASIYYEVNVLVIDPQALTITLNERLSLKNHSKILILKPRDIKAFTQFDLCQSQKKLDGRVGVLTSGSVGKPKCIWISQSSLFKRAQIESQIFQIHEGSVVANVTGLSHELGLTQLFSALLTRSCLVIQPGLFYKNLLNTLNDYKIDGIVGTPFFWKKTLPMLKSEGIKIDLDWASISAGALSYNSFKEFKKNINAERIIKTYGQSETGRSLYCDNPNNENPINLGRPVPGIELDLLYDRSSKAHGNLVHFGETLCDDSALNIVFSSDKKKGHITGDYFSINMKGNYIFLGRKDRMIKRYDQRIFLEEIENQLNKIDGVKNVVVEEFIDIINSHGESSLIAFFVLHKDVQLHEVKVNIPKMLKRFAIPDQLKVIKNIPLSGLGKIDYKAIKLMV